MISKPKTSAIMMIGASQYFLFRLIIASTRPARFPALLLLPSRKMIRFCRSSQKSRLTKCRRKSTAFSTSRGTGREWRAAHVAHEQNEEAVCIPAKRCLFIRIQGRISKHRRARSHVERADHRHEAEIFELDVEYRFSALQDEDIITGRDGSEPEADEMTKRSQWCLRMSGAIAMQRSNAANEA